MSTTAWSRITTGAGRNDFPALLAEFWDRLTPDDLRTALHEAWTLAEFPEQGIDAESWTFLFDQVEYQVDGEARDRDDDLPEIVTLYRGAIEDRRTGMSWTSDLDQARWFANRFSGLRDTTAGYVWRIDIPRDYVLARFTGRNEAEHVVDTSGFEDDEYVLMETATVAR